MVYRCSQTQRRPSDRQRNLQLHVQLAGGAGTIPPKRGVLLDGSPDVSQIIDAIHEVANEIAEAEHNSEEHIARWPTLVAEVIADMPAENLE